MNEDSGRIIDKLIQAEINFLRARKLLKPTDNTGIGALQVDFINAFGSVRYDSLFRSPKSLYSVAAYIQGRKITEATVMKPRPKRIKREVKTKRETRITRKERRKAVMVNEEKVKKGRLESYSPEEVQWLLEYPLPEHLGKDEMNKLKEDYDRTFRVERTPDALAWKLMNLRGKWNVKRKSGERKPRIASVRKRVFTAEREAFLLERMPKRGSFKHGELSRLVEDFNATYQTNLSYTSIRIKCNRLRKELRKKAVGLRVIEVIDVGEKITKRKTHKYTSEQLAWIKRQPHPDCGSIELKALTEEFNKIYATEDNPPASLRAYHEKSAIVHGLRKKTPRATKVRVGKVKYTPEILDFLKEKLPKSGRFAKGALRRIRRALKRDYGLSVTRKALEVKFSGLRKEMKEDLRRYPYPSIFRKELKKARAAHDKVLADLAGVGKIAKPKPQTRPKTLEEMIQETVTPRVPIAGTGEWIVVDVADPNGIQILWSGDHNPGEPSVLSGVSDKQIAECAVKIDGKMFPSVFDHKPILKVYRLHKEVK